MDSMSLKAILTCSYPESVLFYICILLIIGKKELLNFRNKSNILKFFLVTIISTIIPVICRKYSDYYIGNQIVQFTLVIIAYTKILKIEWYNACIGFFLNIIPYIILELVTVLLTSYLTNVPYEVMFTNDDVRFMFSLPVRALQILAVLVLNGLTFTVIEVKILKFTSDICKKITIIYAMLLICFFMVILDVNHFVFNKITDITQQDIAYVTTKISLTFMLSGLIMHYSIKLTRTLKLKDNDKMHDLLAFRALLDAQNNDMIKTSEVKQILDNMINAGG